LNRLSSLASSEKRNVYFLNVFCTEEYLACRMAALRYHYEPPPRYQLIRKMELL